MKVSKSIMSASEAQSCVSLIKENLETAKLAFLELHNREGWRALGYKSWKECCEQEFGYTRQRGYQLLDAAKMSVECQPLVDASGQKPNERVVRELKKVPKEERAAIVKEVASAGPVTATAVAEVVQRTGRFSTVSKRFGPSSKSTPKPMARGGLAAEAMRGETSNGIHVKADVYAAPVAPVKSSGNGGLAEARLLVEACYESNKAKWNSPPPPTPRTIVDAILEALR